MIDLLYTNLVSARLDKFKKIKEGTYNFRCPYCGDSQRYKNKARGYLFQKKAGLIYKCHNCGVGRSFANFLKDQASDLYDEYIMERYKAGTTAKKGVHGGFNVPEPKLDFDKPTFKKKGELQDIRSLNISHPAKKYIVDRKIPEKYFSDLYYVDEFCTWVNTQKPTFTNVNRDHPRVIIPFIDEKGEWFGFQGRSLDVRDKLRYITVMLDDSRTKVFGLNRVDFKKTVYITEGPFDSLFIDNAIAMAGADIDWDTIKDKEAVFVFDNERRNPEIVKRMSNAIDRGYEIVIWPTHLVEKDLNDMTMGGHNVQSLVEFNTYNGLEAHVKLSEWKKV